MRHIKIDEEITQIKEFVLSLPVDPEGSILELKGEPILRVLPMMEEPVDEEKLKAAILHRRDLSRNVGQEFVR